MLREGDSKASLRDGGCGLPFLNKLARQYLECPATSVGVECLLSAARLTFSNLATTMKEETLAARLLAAYNYRLDMYMQV